uniref:Uncharacterized protein n=1 Tax=Plectus sambesii TaxID=2011161 RepID=A0A914VJ94_9BILA
GLVPAYFAILAVQSSVSRLPVLSEDAYVIAVLHCNPACQRAVEGPDARGRLFLGVGLRNERADSATLRTVSGADGPPFALVGRQVSAARLRPPRVRLAHESAVDVRLMRLLQPSVPSPSLSATSIASLQYLRQSSPSPHKPSERIKARGSFGRARNSTVDARCRCLLLSVDFHKVNGRASGARQLLSPAMIRRRPPPPPPSSSSSRRRRFH